MNANTLTETQARLWNLANTHLRRIGGVAAITRNPDPAVRQLGRTPGTREWALLRSVNLVGSHLYDMDDNTCLELLAILEG
jgi:hypothetical protein